MKRLLHAVFRHPLSFAGAVIATAAAVVFLSLFGMELFGLRAGPYVGILAFVVLPGLFILGLVLIPAGWWRDVQRRRRAHAAGSPLPEFPVFDLNKPRVRQLLLALAGLTFVNVTILSAGTYKSVQVMHETEFCGATCHTPMTPEYTAYKASGHSAVPCAACHVGAGAEQFVASKMQGTRQLVELALGSYQRPIPVPTAQFDQLSATCRGCHQARADRGDKLVVRRAFASDEQQTPKTTVLRAKVGGLKDGAWTGIHKHADPDTRIRFVADAAGAVPLVEVHHKDGSTTRYQTAGAVAPAEEARWQTMGCVDCHNRTGHAFERPERAVDAALAAGRLSRELPYVRREALRLLSEAKGTHAEAAAALSRGLAAFYEKEQPEVARAKAAELSAAGRVLGEIYAANVFPEMKISFGTYPSQLGHDGCFRCHDNEHVTAEGKAIGKKCDSCHEVLATEEEDPEIVQLMYP